MKNYKEYSQLADVALDYIRQNNIKCHYYGWVAMVGEVDLLKIDGKIRFFHIKTRKELFKKSTLNGLVFIDEDKNQYDLLGRIKIIKED